MLRVLLCLVASALALPLSSIPSESAPVYISSEPPRTNILLDPIPPPPGLPSLEPSYFYILGSEPAPADAELPEPIPLEPIPEEPAPIEAILIEPIPEELTPKEPALEEPIPEKPIPAEPAPEEPSPEEPIPAEPAPEEPVPEEPVPAEPALEEPIPEEHIPAEPALEEPVPEELAPKEPASAPIAFSEPIPLYVEPVPSAPASKETVFPTIVKLEITKPTFLSWSPSFPSWPSLPSLPSLSSFQLPSWPKIPYLSSIFKRPGSTRVGSGQLAPLRASNEVVDNYRYMPEYYYVI